MKAKNTAITFAIALLTFWLGNYAFNKFSKQQNLEKLLATKECSECDLTYLNLKSANLRGVNLRGANLTGSDLSGADLKGANLDRAILYQADLSNTILSNASFQGANLEMANLKGADLGCSRLNFIMTEDASGTNLRLNFDRNPIRARRLSDFELNFNLTDGAISLNLFGCPDFESANLTGTILPDGSKY
ncbi:MAG: pentapeptide repeat-containing protein [Prochloraceae cyanobacterium]|nr:pentapeptide repeat-containing protein [Prochloraceae cyanobacterium]